MDSMVSTFLCFTWNGHSVKHRRGQHRDHRQWKGCYLPHRLFPSPGDFFSPPFAFGTESLLIAVRALTCAAQFGMC